MQIDSADRSTPLAIRSELGKFGGLNPYNRANWRIVLAQDRLVRRGGIFKTMPTGDAATVFDYEPVTIDSKKVFIVHAKEVKPDAVHTGFRDVQKYPVKGWILERWFPASMYGGQLAWEAVKSSDGITPMMGPYPHEGDYFMLAGPFEHIPDIGDLKMAISMHIRTEEEQPKSYQQMLLEEVNGDLEAERKAYEKTLSDLVHFYESEVEPVLRGTSLGAGVIRNELAESIGDRSHQGLM